MNSTIRRYSRLRPVSDKRRATEKDRAACLRAVRKRAGGKCELKCSPYCTGYGTDGHERRLRSQGGDPLSPENVAWTCRPCHLWAHSHPQAAADLGIIERRNPR